MRRALPTLALRFVAKEKSAGAVSVLVSDCVEIAAGPRSAQLLGTRLKLLLSKSAGVGAHHAPGGSPARIDGDHEQWG